MHSVWGSFTARTLTAERDSVLFNSKLTMREKINSQRLQNGTPKHCDRLHTGPLITEATLITLTV